MSDKKTTKKAYKLLNKEEKNKVATVEIEVPADSLESHREAAIKYISKDLEIKGFRKGMAPRKMVEDAIGEMHILEEMAHRAIIDILPTIIDAEKIDALTQPKIAVTKIAKGNPLVFKAEFILMPEITLTDYKKIAKSIKPESDVKVTDKELNDYIDYVRKSRGEAEHMRKKTSADTAEREAALELKEAPIPELNDEFVKTLGEFKNVDEFKKVLSDNMQAEKEKKAIQKRRMEIVEKIIEESKIELPDAMIDDELHQMMHQFSDELAAAKIGVDDYLKEIKKTKEDMLKEWRPDAVKRVKMNLIIPKIALEEKIEADKEKVKHEAAHLRSHHKDISEERAEAYVTYMLRNDAVFSFLESIK